MRERVDQGVGCEVRINNETDRDPRPFLRAINLPSQQGIACLVLGDENAAAAILCTQAHLLPCKGRRMIRGHQSTFKDRFDFGDMECRMDSGEF